MISAFYDSVFRQFSTCHANFERLIWRVFRALPPTKLVGLINFSTGPSLPKQKGTALTDRPVFGTHGRVRFFPDHLGRTGIDLSGPSWIFQAVKIFDAFPGLEGHGALEKAPVVGRLK